MDTKHHAPPEIKFASQNNHYDPRLDEKNKSDPPAPRLSQKPNIRTNSTLLVGGVGQTLTDLKCVLYIHGATNFVKNATDSTIRTNIKTQDIAELCSL